MNKIDVSIGLLLVLSIGGGAQSKGEWLTGTWTGIGHQVDDGSTWSMRLIARGRMYRVAYPSLKCGGVWKLISLGSRSARFQEKIDYGVRNCSPVGDVVIRRLDGGRIKFSYLYPGETRVGAYAILRRRGR